MSGNPTSLTSSNFTNCSSSAGYGGAIYCSPTDTSISGLIQNCIFSNNTALKGGHDFCVYYRNATPSNPFSSCVTYNSETYTSGHYNGTLYTQKEWLVSVSSHSTEEGAKEEFSTCSYDSTVPTKYVSNTSTTTSSCTSDHPWKSIASAKSAFLGYTAEGVIAFTLTQHLSTSHSTAQLSPLPVQLMIQS